MTGQTESRDIRPSVVEAKGLLVGSDPLRQDILAEEFADDTLRAFGYGAAYHMRGAILKREERAPAIEVVAAPVPRRQ